MDGQQKFALGVVAACVVIASVILAGCAGGSSSGNYHKTFRPPSHVDSAD